MYLHVVLLRLNEEMTPALHERLETILQRTALRCEGIESFRLVHNESANSAGHTHALLSLFSNRQALDAYRESEAHAQMTRDIHPHIRQIIVLDSPLDDVLPQSRTLDSRP